MEILNKKDLEKIQGGIEEGIFEGVQGGTLTPMFR